MAEERTVQPRGFPLWFATLGAPIAWFTHLIILYVLVPVSCAIGGRIFMYITSAVLGGLTIIAGAVAWWMWQEMGEEERSDLIGNMEGSRRGFMLYSGLLASGIFLLAIILATLPIFFLNPCTMDGRI